jgi:hypothetical protein
MKKLIFVFLLGSLFSAYGVDVTLYGGFDFAFGFR